jgi:hypothetical protein
MIFNRRTSKVQVESIDDWFYNFPWTIKYIKLFQIDNVSNKFLVIDILLYNCVIYLILDVFYR